MLKRISWVNHQNYLSGLFVLLACVGVANAQQTVPKNLAATSFKASLTVTPYREGGWSGNATLDGTAVQMQLSSQTATQASYFGSIGPWTWSGTYQTGVAPNIVNRTETGSGPSLSISLVWDLVSNKYKVSFEVPYQWQNKFKDGHVESGGWSHPWINFPYDPEGQVTASNGVFVFGAASRLYGSDPDYDFGAATETIATLTEIRGTNAQCTVQVTSSTGRFSLLPLLPPAQFKKLAQFLPGASGDPLNLKVLVQDKNTPSKTYSDATLLFNYNPVARSGGHDHDGTRDKGSFARGPAAADGSIQVKYTAPDVSGQVAFTIQATTQDGAVCSSTSQNIDVKVEEFKELPGSVLYYLEGGCATATDSRCSQAQKNHLASHNHWGLPAFNGALADLAFLYYSTYSKDLTSTGKLHYNDSNLPWGGRFDVNGNWTSPHAEHRVGINVDLSSKSVPAERKPALREMARRSGFDILVHRELGGANHWHLTFNPGGNKCEVKLPDGSKPLCDDKNIKPNFLPDENTLSPAAIAASALAVQANAQVTFDPISNLYTYQYSFTNDASSSSEVNTILIPLKNAAALNLQAPQGWTGSVWDDASVVSFAATSLGQLPANYVDDENIPASPFQIKPGQTLTGFSFQSADPPVTIDFVAQGYAPLPVLDETDAAADTALSSLAGGFKGTTRGPTHVIDGNRIDDDSFFVRQHYVDFLNREPDAAGFQFWTNDLNSCTTNAQCREVKRINVSAAYFLSIEFQQTGFLVYRTHRAAFGNIPGKPVPVRRSSFLEDTRMISTTPGQVVVQQTGWEQQLEANKQAFFLDFVQRPGFQTAYPVTLTADQFVTKLDANAGGILSAGDRANLLSLLGSTPADVAKRAQVLRAMAENPILQKREFNNAFVLMQYFGYLKRDPDSGPDTDFSGYTFWLGKLNQFGGNFVNAEMVKAFLSSIEYRARFAK